MEASQHFLRCFFSHSISSLCFKLCFFLVKTYCYQLLSVLGRLSEKVVDIWIKNIKSDSSVLSKEKINLTFSISCTMNWYIHINGSTKARLCTLVTPGIQLCPLQVSILGARKVRTSGWLRQRLGCQAY